MIPFTTLHNEYIDRPKLTEQKNPFEYIVPPPLMLVGTASALLRLRLDFRFERGPSFLSVSRLPSDHYWANIKKYWVKWKVSCWWNLLRPHNNTDFNLFVLYCTFCQLWFENWNVKNFSKNFQSPLCYTDLIPYWISWRKLKAYKTLKAKKKHELTISLHRLSIFQL